MEDENLEKEGSFVQNSKIINPNNASEINKERVVEELPEGQ